MGFPNKTKSKVSVIVPTLNIERYLPKLLKSLSEQDTYNFEVIFIDGQSKDSTLDLLNNFKKDNGSKYNVKITIKKPKGISSAFNVGIKESSGEYLIFMGGDDYFSSKTSIRKAIDILNITKPDILSGEVIKSYGSLLTRPRYTKFSIFGFFLRFTFMMPVSHQNTFFNRDIFEKVGFYNEKLKSGMDIDILHRCLRENCKFVITNSNFATFVHRLLATSKLSWWRPIFFDIPYFLLHYGSVPFLSTLRLYFKYRKNIEMYWFDETVYETSQEDVLDIYNLPF